MHTDDPVVPGDILRQASVHGTGEGFTILHPADLDRFDPCAFAYSERGDDLADRPRRVAEFLDDGLSPRGRFIQTSAVFRRLESLSGLRLVEIEIFRMSLLCDVTSAAQKTLKPDAFGDMLLNMPADELGFAGFRDAVPYREQAFAQKRHRATYAAAVLDDSLFAQRMMCSATALSSPSWLVTSTLATLRPFSLSTLATV